MAANQKIAIPVIMSRAWISKVVSNLCVIKIAERAFVTRVEATRTEVTVVAGAYFRALYQVVT